MEIRNLIDFNSMSINDWDQLRELAFKIKNNPDDYRHACSGKIMATLFYEPSTRTQMSFQTAMMRLGGKVIGFSDPNSSSVSKGETLCDTVRIVSSYADLLVIRNPIEGAAMAASLYSRVPVVNAGDGGHLHPTQTLTDLMTVSELKGRTSGLTFGFCGDLLYGRTVHSLIRALMRFENNRYILISTPELRLPEYVRSELKDNGVDFSEVNSLDDAIPELDILYMTRIQRERFSSVDEYAKQSAVYRLTSEKMKKAKDDLAVLHPLPKVDEIDFDVDNDPRAMYFEQAENGMYIRMALIYMLCQNQKSGRPPIYDKPIHGYCPNPRCISNHEKYLPMLTKTVGKEKRCAYCDHNL